MSAAGGSHEPLQGAAAAGAVGDRVAPPVEVAFADPQCASSESIPRIVEAYGSTLTYPNIPSLKCGSTPQVTKYRPGLGKCTVSTRSSGKRLGSGPR